MRKILSVSVAAYNISKFAKQCLDSFTCEDIADFIEVLIVNDGSKDDTKQIAQEYVERYPKVFKLIDKENGGWGSTVNYALKSSTGKYFRLLDGDDYYIKDNMKNYLQFLESINTDCAMSPFITFDDISGEVIEEHKTDYLTEGSVYKIADVQNNLLLSMHAFAFRTDLLKKSDFYITEKCFYTDIEFLLKAINCCKDVIYYGEPIYMYRIGREGQSVSIPSLIKRYEEHLTVLNTLLSFEKTRLRLELEPMFRTRMQEMINIQYSVFMSMVLDKNSIKRLKQLDNELKNNYPWYRILKTKRLHLYRKLHYKPELMIRLTSQISLANKNK